MAEFCLSCWNSINESNDLSKKYIVSKELDFCEGCGQWKYVIIMERKSRHIYVLGKILFPLRVIFFPAEFLIRLILGIIRLIRQNRKGDKFK